MVEAFLFFLPPCAHIRFASMKILMSEISASVELKLELPLVLHLRNLDLDLDYCDANPRYCALSLAFLLPKSSSDRL